MQELVLEFGAPDVGRLQVAVESSELRDIEQELALGRAHDVRLVILREGSVALVKRPGSPEHACELPSGAIHPEESFVDGAARAALAQTGRVVSIDDYLLQLHASFEHGGSALKWTTHVMLANPAGDDVASPDPSLVESTEWRDWDGIRDIVIPALDAAGTAPLRYQARMFELLSGSKGVQQKSRS